MSTIDLIELPDPGRHLLNPIRLLDAATRRNFSVFIHRCFNTVSPGQKYLHNWHIDAIAYHLEMVQSGKINRLIITMPPRSLKSICASVAFPAWLLGHDPTSRIICASYAQDLSAPSATSVGRCFRVTGISARFHTLGSIPPRTPSRRS